MIGLDLSGKSYSGGAVIGDGVKKVDIWSPLRDITHAIAAGMSVTAIIPYSGQAIFEEIYRA